MLWNIRNILECSGTHVPWNHPPDDDSLDAPPSQPARTPQVRRDAYLPHFLGPEAQQGQVKVQVDDRALRVHAGGKHDL